KPARFAVSGQQRPLESAGADASPGGIESAGRGFVSRLGNIGPVDRARFESQGFHIEARKDHSDVVQQVVSRPRIRLQGRVQSMLMQERNALELLQKMVAIGVERSCKVAALVTLAYGGQ